MAWDDDKGPGDGLPSSEWDAMVTHQKKNRAIVQESEPPVGDEGQLWAQTTAVYQLTETLASNTLAFTVDTANGVAYYDDGTNGVIAYDLVNDTQLWSHTHNGSSLRDIAIDDTYVYSVGGGGNVVSALKSDGSQNWNTSVTTTTLSVVEVDSNRVYTGGFDDTVTALSVSNGTEEWSYSPRADTIRAIQSDGTDVYFGDDSSTVESVTASGGTSNWTKTLDNDCDALELGGGNLFAGTPVNTLYSLNPSDGSENYTASKADNIINIVYVSSTEMYVGYNSDFEEVDPADGSTVETFTYSDGADELYIYNDNFYIQGGSTAGKVDSVNEYTLYISDGSVWMNEST